MAASELRLLQKIRPRHIVLLAVGVAICFLLWFRIDAIRGQLRDWKVLPQTEAVTELYFADPRALPADYTPGQTQSVAFCLHNRTGAPATYTYVVREQTQDATIRHEVLRQTVRLASGAKTTIHVSVGRTDLGPRTKVSIGVVNSSLTINYWTKRSI